jgi:hypothetical protein
MDGIISKFKLLSADVLKKFTKTEARLLESTQGKKIYDCTDHEIKQLLAYCCIMVGIQKPPADEQKSVLIAYLRKYYGVLTTGQAVQAFELVANGELGQGPQEHYNCISPLYLSGVLRAYMQKLNGVMSRYRIKEAAIGNPAKVSTPETYYKRLLKVVEEYNVIPLFWAWDEVFDYLCGRNNEELSPPAADFQAAIKNSENQMNAFRNKQELRNNEATPKATEVNKKQLVIQFLKKEFPGAMMQSLTLKSDRNAC